jgi:hypothetical protein
MAIPKPDPRTDHFPSPARVVAIFAVGTSEIKLATDLIDLLPDTSHTLFRVVCLTSTPKALGHQRITTLATGGIDGSSTLGEAMQVFESSLPIEGAYLPLTVKNAEHLQSQLEKLASASNSDVANDVLEELRNLIAGQKSLVAPSNTSCGQSESSKNDGSNCSRIFSESVCLPSVNIVNYEAQRQGGWIFTRLSETLFRALEDMGVEAHLSSSPTSGFDVVHHIPYHAVKPIDGSINTSLVTHVDSPPKLWLLKWQFNLGVRGICMSSTTARSLNNRFGVDDFYFAVPPASRYVQPRKSKIGVFFNRYRDGRKRETELIQFAQVVGPTTIKIVIMGENWDGVVIALEALGVDVELHPQFEVETYEELVREVDYVVYFGYDEGAISVADAIACGTRVIVTPQGFHLDYKSPNVCYASDGTEAARVFLSDRLDRETSIQLMSRLSWSRYGQTHVSIWNTLLADRDAAVPREQRN